MAIVVQCVCGKAYRMADDKAGRKLRCRSCDAIMRIPAVSAKPKKPRKPKPAAATTRPARPAAAQVRGNDSSLDGEIELVLDDESSDDEILVLDLEEEDDDSDAELSLGLGLPIADVPPDSTEFPALDLTGDPTKPTQVPEAAQPSEPKPTPKPAAPVEEPPPTVALDIEPEDAVAVEDVFAIDEPEDVLEVDLDDDPVDRAADRGTTSASTPPQDAIPARESDDDPFAFLDADDDESTSRRSKASGRATPGKRTTERTDDWDDIDVEPESDESIEVRDEAGEDDVVFDSGDEIPTRASRRSGPRSNARSKSTGTSTERGRSASGTSNAGRRKAALDDSSDDLDARAEDGADAELDGELEATWVNFAWACGLTVAAIVAFFYLRWLEASGDTFSGEGGRGLQKFLAWAYGLGGAWAVSGVLLAIAAFFGWCGWSELATRRQQAARERRRERIRNRR